MSKETDRLLTVSPTTEANYHNENWRTEGLLLRDYFAAKAMPDLIAGYSRNQGSGPYLDASPNEIAYWAYRYADAMLAARSQ